MHGSQECDGNVQQLCVRDSSKTSQRDWWNFIQCQNFQDLKRVGDLSLAKQCAKVIGKDWDAEFSACYTGSRGAKLLRNSGKLTYRHMPSSALRGHQTAPLVETFQR